METRTPKRLTASQAAAPSPNCRSFPGLGSRSDGREAHGLWGHPVEPHEGGLSSPNLEAAESSNLPVVPIADHHLFQSPGLSVAWGRSCLL